MSQEVTVGLFKESYEPFRKYWQFLLANLALGILITVAFWSSDNPNFLTMVTATFWSFTICFTQWTGNALIAGYLNRKVSWIEFPIQRTILGVLGTTIYSTLAYFVVQLTMMYIFFGEFPDQPLEWLLSNIELPIIISLSFTTVFVSTGFFNRWKESAEKADKFKAQMMTYKYESLRNQLNPHFLFNSFNVLTDLVYEDPDLAAKFIQQLSELYRYVLDSRDKELVSLAEELAFIDSYLFLLKIRFEDKLIVENNLKPRGELMIVPMSLQILIENAVKHNEISTLNPLRIVLEQQGDQVVVWNTLHLKNVGGDSKKTGIKNIKDQYALWTERPIEVRMTELDFQVKLPLLKKGGE